MNNYEKKAGHPILAIILGILGILIALLLTLLLGVVAGAIAGILGLAALLIGLVGVRKGGRGTGGIIVGALAIILAVAMSVTTVSLFTKIQTEAAKYTDEAPLVAKSLDKPALGILGMLLNMKDEGTAQEMIDQFKLIEDKLKVETDSNAKATEAPVEETATEAPAEEAPAEAEAPAEGTAEEAPKAND